MDAHPAPSAPTAPDPAHSKFHAFVQIAMLLAIITGVEIVIVYLPFAKWLVVTALVVLSAVKFMFVIFFFMHLKWDKLFCTILFFIGLGLAGGTAIALLALFDTEAAQPLVLLGTPATKALISSV